MAFYHSNDLRINSFGQDPPSGCDVVDDLVEGGAFDLLALEIGHRVHEVEPDAALTKFPDEKLLLFR